MRSVVSDENRPAVGGRALGWLAFYGAVAAAWAALGVIGVSAGSLEAFCAAAARDAGFLALTGLWALSALAMTAPTAAPMLSAYDDLVAVGAAPASGTARLAAGYGVVWLAFAPAAALLQLGLARAGLTGAPAFDAALLALAGLYQFSRLKHACVTACRAPMLTFLSRGVERPFAIGLEQGLACLGCCWAMMLLGLVGGAMSLGFMALGMLVMTLEKLPEIGAPLTRPLGALLLGAAALRLFFP